VRIIFWLSLIGILYAYVGYPLAIGLMARLWPRHWMTASITPTVSIVLAVHNGVSLLQHKIQHLIDLDYPSIKEIIVVSDGSNDGTAELLVRQHYARLKSVVLTAHVGKAAALNAGVRRAKADIILFVDIRPEIAPGAVKQLVSNFADSRVGCVAGELTLSNDGHDATSSAVSSFYWRYEQWIRKSEALVDSPAGVYGGFYAIRRELAMPLPAGMILDDMFQPLSIIRQGYRSVLDPQARVFDRWPEKFEHEFHRKVRTLAGNFQLFQLAPWTLTPRNRVLFQFVSHKVLRLIVPYLLILLLISSVILSVRSPLYAAFAALQVVVLSAAVAGLRYRIPFLHRIAAPASALLVLNAAAICALYKFLFTRGPLWKIWTETKPQPARTIPESEPLVLRKPPAAASAPLGDSLPLRASVIDIGKTLSTDSQP
jgi:cellulose synthase/poly-beta-1,6-N-acetylglucosamine synthase-like glycosyltransferase